MAEKERVPLARGRVWELLTENGTRHLVDLRDPEGRTRRMRVPGPGRGEHEFDGQWQGRVGLVRHHEMESMQDWSRGDEVIVGESAAFTGPGWRDWFTTTTVVAVRALDDTEVPPLGEIAFEPPHEPDDAGGS